MANALGRVVLSNSQADELFGYGSNGLRGHLLEVLMPERFRSKHVGQRSGFAKAPQRRPMGAGRELFGLRADGEEFPVEISLSPVYTDEGVLVMSAIRDITERKQIERALHEKNLELADASRAKDHFLSSMSHELRTPLNAVLGFTGTILMGLPGPINEEQTRQLKMVQSSARHLLSLINDILDITKIAAGAVEIARREFDVIALINEVIGMFGPLAEAKRIALLLTAPFDKLIVTSDRRGAQQILINLVNNAIKFTDRGQVHVSVRCDDRACDTLRIVVEDTGIGIEPDKLGLLFRPFTQLDQGTTRKFEGTGLGLHVSERLARLLGATISVQSTFGVGSIFTFDLPIMLSHVDLPASARGTDDPKRETDP